MQINSSQIAGLVAFLPAALAAAIAFGAAGRGARDGRRTWAVCTTIYTLLVIEMLADERYRVKGAIDQWLMVHGVYQGRRPVQAAMLIALVLLAAFVFRVMARSAKSKRLLVARIATALVVVMFVAEAISLHAVDAIMFRRVGPLLLIAWLWIACGWTTAISAARRSG